MKYIPYYELHADGRYTDICREGEYGPYVVGTICKEGAGCYSVIDRHNSQLLSMKPGPISALRFVVEENIGVDPSWRGGSHDAL